MQKVKQIAVNLLLSLAAVIVALTLIEVAVRLLNMYSTYNDSRIVVSSPVPGIPQIARANLINKHLHTNSRNLRDDEISINKRDDEVRIAIVGNSVTIGYEVDQADLFTEIVQQQISQRDDLDYHLEVINAGQAGLNIDHFEKYTDHYVYIYEPDVILYQFCWNDIAIPSRMRKGRFPERVAQQGFQRLLLRHWKTYLILYRLTSKREFLEKLVNHYDDQKMVDGFYDDLLGWAHDIEAHGYRFVMTLFPMAVEVQGREDLPDVAEKFISQREKLISTIRQEGIEVIDFSEPLYQYYMSTGQNLYADQGHFNETGHQVIADLLMPILLDLAASTRTDSSRFLP